jgi:hypothetical protein
MDNDQNCDSYINIPSSLSYIYCFWLQLVLFCEHVRSHELVMISAYYQLSTELLASLYSPGTVRMRNISSLLTRPLVASEILPHSCFLATAVLMSLVCTSRQRIYKSQYQCVN